MLFIKKTTQTSAVASTRAKINHFIIPLELMASKVCLKITNRPVSIGVKLTNRPILILLTINSSAAIN